MALRFSIYNGVPKSGAPLWVTGSFETPPEFFDISARAPADTSIDQMRLMMQALLSDRFHLALHTVTADAPLFALVLSKPGPSGHRRISGVRVLERTVVAAVALVVPYGQTEMLPVCGRNPCREIANGIS